jgi:hypothetical protein
MGTAIATTTTGAGEKSLILGCASTGAKFTPNNHRPTGDPLLDSICSGMAIKTSPLTLVAEAEALYGMGCRYYHYHARNQLTQEQTTDNEIYQAISRNIQRRCGEMLLSFGASRNGGEVRENIARFGEWERVSQCGIPLHLGGAHFVTIQAAVELQIICELERHYQPLSLDYIDSAEFGAHLSSHEPSENVLSTALDTYSTSGGSDYGRTSPRIQFQVYGNAIDARRRLGLFHEVEWVQLLRSFAMTRYAVERKELRLGDTGQLNITLLFGFSPRLPFPSDYAEFKHVVDRARSLAYNLGDADTPARHISISVGAAVMPQQAHEHFRPLDVGPRRGAPADALRRLAAYAAQPDSGVDILRVGMEDTPYAVNADGGLLLADNCELTRIAIEELHDNGARIELDHDRIVERLGLHTVRDGILAEQRRHPLGKVS